ncbi:MAG: glycosyltransferase family 4 protein [Nitrospinae bacterium]|nr:glycosyltransferase family 4 protein [Nitrospinota bacterium]
MPLQAWFLVAALSNILNIPLDSFLRLKNQDICIFAGTCLPRIKKPSVIIVYDVIPLLFPQFFLRRLCVYYRIFLPKFIQQADAIISISYCTKEDILKKVPVDKEKIHVIYPGISESFKIIRDFSKIDYIKSKYNTGEHYILFAATIEPRKNIIGLLKAFRLLCNQKNITHKLVIVGRRGWRYKEVFQTLDKFDSVIKGRIVFTDFVPDGDLLYLYNGANIFVYPSFYEGFGLPPLEAMACGCPVVVSNVASLPEACGDAAYYINPYNINSIAEGIYKVITDGNLKQELIQKGLKQVKMFNWDKTAKQYLSILEDVIQKRN